MASSGVPDLTFHEFWAELYVHTSPGCAVGSESKVRVAKAKNGKNSYSKGPGKPSKCREAQHG